MSRWIKFAVSLAITGASLWWTFRDTHWPDLWGSLRSANWVVLIPFLMILAVIHVARTIRWGNLLSPQERVSFKNLNEASAIGFMMLVILPFRLGEFARPFLIAQRSSIRRSAAMTSVVFERIVDAVLVATLLRGLMFFMPDEGEGIARIRIGADVMFTVFFSGFVFLLFARWQHDKVIGAMRMTLGRLAPGLTERAVHIVDGFLGALRQLPDARNFASFLGLTALYWVVNGLSMSLLANAFDCSGGTALNCQPLHISVFEGFVVLGVLVAGMMIPAAPGSAGTAQASVLLGLSVFVPQSVVSSGGVAFANVLWITQIAQQIVVGLVFMVLSHSSFSEIAGNLSQSQSQDAASEASR
jgi:hypothetical protein